MIRRAVLAALACTTLVVLTACAQSGATPHPSGSWLTAARADREYREAASLLVLAEGSRWPTAPESATGPDGAPQYYQVGAATNDAQMFWFCSWTTADVHAGSTSFDATASTALQRVRHVRLGTSGSDDDTRQLLTGVIQAVAAHDAPTVQEFNDKDCAS